MDHPFQYLEQAPEPEGTALGVGVSLTLHVAALVLVFMTVQEAPKPAEEQLRYVELVPGLSSPLPSTAPRNFVEAPGAAVEQPPSPDAALSDANRRASSPNPSGTERTARPGDGSGGLFVPGPQAAAPGARSSAAAQPPAEPASRGSQSERVPETELTEGMQYRVESRGSQSEQTAGMTAPVDWRAAIREAGRTAPMGTGGSIGGETGFAESGPISFESQWYDWGPYAAAMVARIRVHWYNNMPDIIRMGMKGVVVIRFTIQRSGQITDVTILESSGVPPYDFAAKKAIELASPLAPLPKDFPEPSERVTAAFYYNSNPPRP